MLHNKLALCSGTEEINSPPSRSPCSNSIENCFCKEHCAILNKRGGRKKKGVGGEVVKKQL